MLQVPLTLIPLGAGIIDSLVRGYLAWWDIVLVVLGVPLFVCVSFLAFHRVRVERDQARTLDIKGTVENLERVNANHVALGQGEADGNVITWIKCDFAPMIPALNVKTLELELWDRRQRTTSQIDNPNFSYSCSARFEITKGIVADTKARLVVTDKNKRCYYSGVFPISFEGIKESKP